jgi:hypothetical protein
MWVNCEIRILFGYGYDDINARILSDHVYPHIRNEPAASLLTASLSKS